MGPWTFAVTVGGGYSYTDHEGHLQVVEVNQAYTFYDACLALDFVNAAIAHGVDVSGDVSTSLAVDDVFDACVVDQAEAGGDVGLLVPATPDMAEDPSATGADQAPPGGEESWSSLGAPGADAGATGEGTTRSPGESDGSGLSEQYYDQCDPLPDYDVCDLLLDAGLAPEDVEAGLADVQHNEPPPGEPHPTFGQDDRRNPDTILDPVVTFSGQYQLTAVDLDMPARALPLRFRRIYRSGEVYFGPLGYNWDHNYNVYLRPLTGGGAAVWTGALAEDVFTPTPEGTFESPLGVALRLEHEPVSIANPERWVVTDRGGVRQMFEIPDGWPRTDRYPLVRIEDRHGNGQSLRYDADGRLAEVRDDDARSLLFGYRLADGLLEQVSDHTGRRWTYEYDWDVEHLVRVTTPPTGEYPDGLAACYEYDRWKEHPALRHNMVRVTDTTGQVTVENHYGEDPSGWDFGRVVWQEFGGWEATYHATRLQYVPRSPEAINVPAWQIEAVDPGTLFIYTFNYRGDLLDERFRLSTDGTYRLVARTYRYDRLGHCIERREPNGLGLLAAYDVEKDDALARENLLSVTLTCPPTAYLLDRTIQRFSYDDRHRLKTIADETGATTTRVYDDGETTGGFGDVVRIEHPDATLPDGTVQASSENFTYDEQGQLTEHRTASGSRHTFAYGANGSAVGLLTVVVRDADGAAETERFAYDEWGNLATVEDGLGNLWQYEHDALGRLTRQILPALDGTSDEVRWFYTPMGLVRRRETPRGAYTDASVTDDFLADEFAYDVLGQLTETVLGANTAAPRRWTFSRGAEGQVLRTTDPVGNVSENEYDERGLLLERRVAVGTAHELRWRFQYDRNGNRVSVDDPAGYRTDLEYDAWDRLTTTMTPGAEGERTEVRTTYGEANHPASLEVWGLPGPGEEARSLSTASYDYDERGRVWQRTADGLAYVAYHDAADRLVRIVDPRGSAIAYEHDGLDRWTSRADSAGNRVGRVFDPAGNLVRLEEQDVDASGAARTFTTTLSYDARRRLVAVTDPLGNATHTEYDARDLVVAVVDPLGRREDHAHDLEGNLLRRTIVASTPAEHLWERDGLGRVTSYRDPEGSVTTFEYSAADQLVAVRYPDGSGQEWSYESGTLASELLAGGTRIEYDYDAVGQPERLRFTPAPDVASTTDLELAYDGMFRPVRLSQGGRTLTRTYDARARLLAESLDGVGASFAYDDLSGTLDLSYPDGRRDRLHTDTLGRVTSITLEALGSAALTGGLDAGTTLATYEYAGPRRLARRTLANGATTAYAYDDGRRLVGLAHRDAAGGEILTLAYAYDAAGRRRVTYASPSPAAPVVHDYDELSRLAAQSTLTLDPPTSLASQLAADAYVALANAAPTTTRETFSIDRAGDRLERRLDATLETYRVNEMRRIDALERGGVVTPFAYAGDGHLASSDRHRYTYDALGRLAEIRDTSGAALMQLVYDPGSRIAEVVASSGTTRLHHLAARCIEERDATGAPTRQRLFGVGGTELLLESGEGQNVWAHHDALNSVLALSGDSGAVSERYTFSSFGDSSIWDPSGAARDVSAVGLSARFAGHFALGGTGLYLTPSRVYDPPTGRFLQRDPLLYTDGANPYLYAAHDPANYVDPDGRFVFAALALGAVAGGAVGAIYGNQQNHSGWQFAGDVAAGVSIGLLAGVGGALVAEGIAYCYGTGSLAVLAGSASTTTPTATGLAGTAQILSMYGLMSAAEGTVVRATLSGSYPTVVAPPDAASTAEDFAWGVAGGSLVVAFRAARGAATAKELVNRTKDIGNIAEEVIDPETGRQVRRIWGQTEGYVYASESGRMLGGRKLRDPGKIVFVEQAAGLFERHPVDGIFSGWKRAFRGEFRTRRPGDLIVQWAEFDDVNRVLTVRVARMGPHDPNIPGLYSLSRYGWRGFNEAERRAGRLLVDQALSPPVWGQAFRIATDWPDPAASSWMSSDVK